MLEQIVEILSQYTPYPAEQMTEETRLVADMQLSSLDVVNLIVEAEEIFGVEIADEKLVELHTVGDVVRCIDRLK